MTVEDHLEGERAFFRVRTSSNVVTVYSDGEVLITPSAVAHPPADVDPSIEKRET